MDKLDYVFVFIIHVIYSVAQQPIVETVYGKLRGDVTMINDVPISVFLGIPFAKPPTGVLRIQPPARLDRWHGIRDAMTSGPACPQTSSRYPIDEDCLYLNIYIPKNSSQVHNESLPVMVYIHGGAFIFGSAHIYNGSAIVSQSKPVILVVIQYRLGLLGFATTGDDDIPGNQGLLDQTFALQWVKENIGAFGGDTDRITLFGESSGGESILLHMLNPRADGLFHRAIVQNAPAAWRYPNKELFKGVLYDTLSSYGCTPELMQACIQNTSWTVLSQFNQQLPRVIDGVFMSAQPWDLFQSGYVSDAELIIGFSNDDGLVLAELLDGLHPNSDVIETGLSDPIKIHNVLVNILTFLVSDIVNIRLSSDTKIDSVTWNRQILRNMPQFISIIKARYANTADDPIATVRSLYDALRDSGFVAWQHWIVQQLSHRGNNVRVFSFEHRSEYLGRSGPAEVPLYAPHAHSLRYIFGGTLVDERFTEEERQLTRSMIHAWTTFAASGQPMFLTNNNNTVDWPLYDGQMKYVTFDVNMTQDSIRDYGTTWQPISEFWLAVQSLAVFDDDVNNMYIDDETEGHDEDSSSDKFQSDVFGLSEFQADFVVIFLLCATFLLLLTTLALCCYARKRSNSHVYKT